MTQKIGAGLLSCTEKIWDTADTLRGAGIKASEWPAYMMPFFALMMLESRLRRFRKERIEEFKNAVAADFKIDDKSHMDWLDHAAKAANKGYHRDLLIHEKGLRETCAVPGGNFLNRLLSHLDQYDPATKRLLGIGYRLLLFTVKNQYATRNVGESSGLLPRRSYTRVVLMLACPSHS